MPQRADQNEEPQLCRQLLAAVLVTSRITSRFVLAMLEQAEVLRPLKDIVQFGIPTRILFELHGSFARQTWPIPRQRLASAAVYRIATSQQVVHGIRPQLQFARRCPHVMLQLWLSLKQCVLEMQRKLLPGRTCPQLSTNLSEW